MILKSPVPKLSAASQRIAPIHDEIAELQFLARALEKQTPSLAMTIEKLISALDQALAAASHPIEAERAHADTGLTHLGANPRAQPC